jgi:UDP-N-acetylglucosamine:LPS N-acetylglucosamine transferase
VVAVFGGSLGARRINQATLELVESWASRRDLTVYHVVGRRDWPEMSARAARLGLDRELYRPVEYEERMPTLYAAADLAVCRAGATSIAELAVVGVPAVLVPLPGAPSDHQTANARRLAQAGAAVSLADGECNAVRLAGEIDSLLANRFRMEEMSRRARQVGRPQAADHVASLVEEQARPKGHGRRRGWGPSRTTEAGDGAPHGTANPRGPSG